MPPVGQASHKSWDLYRLQDACNHPGRWYHNDLSLDQRNPFAFRLLLRLYSDSIVSLVFETENLLDARGSYRRPHLCWKVRPLSMCICRGREGTRLFPSRLLRRPCTISKLCLLFIQAGGEAVIHNSCSSSPILLSFLKQSILKYARNSETQRNWLGWSMWFNQGLIQDSFGWSWRDFDENAGKGRLANRATAY